MSEAELKEAKKKISQMHSGAMGVTGFGVGDGTVQIYVKTEEDGKQFPATIDNVPIEIVVSEEIVAL